MQGATKPQVKIKLTKFRPRFDEGMENFLWKWIHKNHWKVQHTHTVEDFYQEGYLLFLEAVDRYIDNVDNYTKRSPDIVVYKETQDWFMTLYKRMVWTWTCDQAAKSSKTSIAVLESDMQPEVEGDESVSIESLLQEDNEGLLSVMIKQAPSEVAAVLKYVFDTPAEVLAEAEAAWKSAGKRKPGGNQFLCKMLGMEHEKVNLVKLTEDYFLGV